MSNPKECKVRDIKPEPFNIEILDQDLKHISGVKFIIAIDDEKSKSRETNKKGILEVPRPKSKIVLAWAGEESGEEKTDESSSKGPESEMTTSQEYAATGQSTEKPSEEPQCYVCKKMKELLSKRNNGQFPVSAIEYPSRWTLESNNWWDNKTNQFTDSYKEFIKDPNIRMRYYVQAHLHRFGYYPELMGIPRNAPIKDDTLGFPNFQVHGIWNEKSKKAYKTFLKDVGETTKWTLENDILQKDDIDLIMKKCSKFERNGFKYISNYTISKGQLKIIRPFKFKKDNLKLLNPLKNSKYAKILGKQTQRNCEPLEKPEFPYPPCNSCSKKKRKKDPCKGVTKKVIDNIKDAPSENLPDDIKWPVLTSNENWGWKISYQGKGNCGDAGGRSVQSCRKYGKRMHGGIDLIDDYGDPIVAVTDGQIIGFDNQAPAASCFLFIYHKTLNCTINYGEVHHESLIRLGLMVGDTVKPGQVIGTSTLMEEEAPPKGRGSPMLHFETYKGYQNSWLGAVIDGKKDLFAKRYDPTKLLIAIRKKEYDRIKKSKDQKPPSSSIPDPNKGNLPHPPPL